MPPDSQQPAPSSPPEGMLETSERKSGNALGTPRKRRHSSQSCHFRHRGRLVVLGANGGDTRGTRNLVELYAQPSDQYLQRLRMPRGVASVITVLLFCSGAAGFAWTIGGQLSKLSQELPTYRKTIVQRVAEARNAFRGGALEKIQTTMDQVADDLGSKAPEKPSFGSPQPVPVVITSSKALLDFDTLGTLLPVLEPLSVAGLVILLSIRR